MNDSTKFRITTAAILASLGDEIHVPRGLGHPRSHYFENRNDLDEFKKKKNKNRSRRKVARKSRKRNR